MHRFSQTPATAGPAPRRAASIVAAVVVAVASMVGLAGRYPLLDVPPAQAVEADAPSPDGEGANLAARPHAVVLASDEHG